MIKRDKKEGERRYRMEMSKIGVGIVQAKKWFSGRNSSVRFLPYDSTSKSDMHMKTSP